MPSLQDKVVPGPVSSECSIREAVCIHTKKVFDSCREKECIEDLRVFLTRSSQEALERCVSIKAGTAELLCACIDVEPITFNRGFYTVDVRYFYRICADAFVGTVRPVEIVGLAVFDKRTILFGGESNVKTFSTRGMECRLDCQDILSSNLPDVVVDAVDPLILGVKMRNACDCCEDNILGCCEVPLAVSNFFPEDLLIGNECRKLHVTLGQFSLIRMERDTQILTPIYDYCLPEKECDCGCDCPEEDPCELFRRVKFPVDEFIPNRSPENTPTYKDPRYCTR